MIKKNNAALIILIIVIGILTYFYFNLSKDKNKESNMGTLIDKVIDEIKDESDETNLVEVFAEGLDVPWALAFLPSGDMLVTERKGTVRFVSKEGVLQETPISTITDVRQIGEGGLLGIVLDPEFPTNNFMYLYFTYAGSGDNTLNRVVKYSYEGGELRVERVVVDEIPGASNHDGGRIKFGPDFFLYITTGDAQNPSNAQNKNSLAGKILRVTRYGEAVEGNPFGNMVYSYGHRNPQGITWDEEGNLWEVEHGSSAFDEVNKIIAGQNYGWPEIRGDETESRMTNPFIHSGQDTWAPSGAVYLNGSLYFAGLRGEALYEYVIDSGELKTHFKGEFGRLRDVIVGPDKMLYVTTSNRDGRGLPKSDDDKILKINPEKL